TVAPRAVGRVALDAAVATASNPAHELLTADLSPRPFWFFAMDKELDYSHPQFDADWSDGKLIIHAKSLLRDLCVFVDRLDPEAEIGEQMITLLPGDHRRFMIDSKLPLTKEQLTRPPVLRC